MANFVALINTGNLPEGDPPTFDAASEAWAHLADESEDEGCEGHPAGPSDPMGETVYCDGSCRVRPRG